MTLRLIAACLYDALILIALLMVVTAFCVLANGGEAIATASRWYQCLLAVVVLIYQIISIRGCGQTIGMRAWHLKIISENQGIKIRQIIARFILTIPAYILALLIFKKPQQLIKKWTKTELVRS